MVTKYDFLKDFEYYCNNVDGLSIKRESTRLRDNFKRIMNDLNNDDKDFTLNTRYQSNLKRTEELVENLSLAHNTSLECILSIILGGDLVPLKKLESNGYPFNYRITSKGINEELFDYIFLRIQSKDWLYGMYEIRFKRDIENQLAAKFLPMASLNYHSSELKDYLMDIKDWRAYLTKYIAVNFDIVDNYINNTPVHLMPEFLFLDQIPISYIEAITCATEYAFTNLTHKIKYYIGNNEELLSIIKVADK